MDARIRFPEANFSKLFWQLYKALNIYRLSSLPSASLIPNITRRIRTWILSGVRRNSELAHRVLNPIDRADLNLWLQWLTTHFLSETAQQCHSALRLMMETDWVSKTSCYVTFVTLCYVALRYVRDKSWQAKFRHKTIVNTFFFLHNHVHTSPNINVRSNAIQLLT